MEETRRGGHPAAFGELVNCPFCMSPWAAAALLGGFTVRPRLTRMFASLLGCVAASHFLHQIYALRKETKRRQEQRADREEDEPQEKPIVPATS